MFSASEKPEEVARAVRDAERAAQEAAQAASRIWRETTDARAEDGKDDVRVEAARIVEARLKASVAGKRAAKLRETLRGVIAEEHARGNSAAEATLKSCEAEDKALAEKIESPAIALVRLIGQRHGAPCGAAAALVVWDSANGRFSTMIGQRFNELRSSAKAGDGLARTLLETAESVDGGATLAARRQAAQQVLARRLDVDHRIAELLPPTPAEQPPAKLRKPELEEEHLPTWGIEPSLKNPRDEGVVKFG